MKDHYDPDTEICPGCHYIVDECMCEDEDYYANVEALEDDDDDDDSIDW